MGELMKNLLIIGLALVVFLICGCTNDEVVRLEKQVQELEVQLQNFDNLLAEKNKQRILLQQAKAELEENNVALNSDLEDIKIELSNKEDELKDAYADIEQLESKIEEIKDREILVVDANDKYLHYIYVEEDNTYQDVTIIGDNIDGIVESYEFGTIELGSSSIGGELAITVLGSIYNVELVEVEYNSETQRLDVKDTIDFIEEVRNEKIIINSIFPEGIPTEMVQWENEEGEEFSYVISEDGYGFGGVIIWNK